MDGASVDSTMAKSPTSETPERRVHTSHKTRSTCYNLRKSIFLHDMSTSHSISHVDDETDQDDLISIRSSLSRKSALPPELSEPLTNSAALLASSSQSQEDPYYLFRSELYRKLEAVDESLAEFLRVVHQTVRCFLRKIIR